MDQVQKNNLSKSIKVFGWFFIVGGFYVFSYIKPLVFSGYLLDTVVALNAANINYTLSSYRILNLLSTVGSIILLAAGILIVRLNDTGRKLAIFYASFGILHSLFWILYHLMKGGLFDCNLPLCTKYNYCCRYRLGLQNFYLGRLCSFFKFEC